MIVQSNEGKFGGKLGGVKFSHPFLIIDIPPKLFISQKFPPPIILHPHSPKHYSTKISIQPNHKNKQKRP